MFRKNKTLKWLRKEIKENYKAIKIFHRCYHDGSEQELEEFNTLMHKLVDQVKKMEYELDKALGKF